MVHGNDPFQSLHIQTGQASQLPRRQRRNEPINEHLRKEPSCFGTIVWHPAQPMRSVYQSPVFCELQRGGDICVLDSPLSQSGSLQTQPLGKVSQ